MSTKIGLFYGSQTGKTADVAQMIQKELGDDVVELHDIAGAQKEDKEGYEYLIIGSPTWNIGELQSDWEGFFPELDEIDFSGKKVAYFAVGDQIGYPDNFLDAMGILAEKIAERGATRIGDSPTSGYDFNESKAIENGKFIGLGIDEDDRSDMTEARIKTWVAQIKKEFKV